MASRQFQFFPLVSHAQFYLGDSAGKWDPGDCWNDAAVARNLAVMGEALGVGTVMVDGIADVLIEIAEAPPKRLRGGDQVVEASFSVPSGQLTLSTPMELDLKPGMDVAPGTYRARISWENIGAVHAKLSAMSDPGALWSRKPRRGELRDRYRIQLWPAKKRRVEFIRRLKGPLTW